MKIYVNYIGPVEHMGGSTFSIKDIPDYRLYDGEILIQDEYTKFLYVVPKEHIEYTYVKEFSNKMESLLE